MSALFTYRNLDPKDICAKWLAHSCCTVATLDVTSTGILYIANMCPQYIARFMYVRKKAVRGIFVVSTAPTGRRTTVPRH